MVSVIRYQKDFYGWKSVPFAILVYIPYSIFLVVRFAIRRSKSLLEFARKKGIRSYLAALMLVIAFFTTSIFGIAFSVHAALSILDQNQKIQASADARFKIRFGKCQGFGLELQKKAPLMAIAAAESLLNGLDPVDLRAYSLVDVVAESTVPHLCGGDLYSGKIPPGANTAYLIQFSHEKTDLDFERGVEGIVTTSTSKQHTNSRVLVANYPEFGWQAIYSDSAEYSGFFK